MTVLFVCWATAATAATVPQLMNYQGRLNDNTGAPVTGTKSMVFSLYTSATNTAAPPLWTETQNVNVNNGSLNATLGSVMPLPATVFDNSAVWLGIAVGGDQEMTPRQQITSVGYAQRAATADSLSSVTTLTASNTIISTVTTGIPPLQIVSTTVVPNLNADMVGGKHAGELVLKAGDTMTGDLTVPNLYLPATTATQGIIYAGASQIHSYGTNNFFAGADAGNFTMTGTGNTGIGTSALVGNAAGNYNTASGHEALHSNTDGALNTASGGIALYSNTTGYFNTAIGSEALYSNSTGALNTAIGVSALLSNTTGSFNTAVGVGAGFNQTTGSYNIYLGADVEGVDGESNITRIGDGQTDAYIAGVIHSNGLVTAGSVTITGVLTATVSAPGQIVSSVPTGTAPFQVISTTMVPNLNADMVGGMHASDLVLKAGDTMTGDLAVPLLALPATTATAGIIKQGANPFIHAYGSNNVFAGSGAGNLTMTGGYNSAVGVNSLTFNTTGGSDTAMGQGALHSNTTGYQNTAMGQGALTSNTTGFQNTASGQQALFSNTTGYYNTAVGQHALYSNTSGDSNTAAGMNALYSNSTGYNNTAGGRNVLFSNTTGYNNTASGSFALDANSIGSDNVAEGMNALGGNTTANKNTAIGSGALYTQSYNNSGTAWDSFNTAVGYQALYSNQPVINVSGMENTAVGAAALFSNTTGYDNTASGANALYFNTIGQGNTATGVNALYNNTEGGANTAIGNSALYFNTTGDCNTAAGSNALYSNTTGAYNTAGGQNALHFNTTGSGNTAGGYQALSLNTTGSMNTVYGVLALYSNTGGNSNTASGYQSLYSNTTGVFNAAGGRKSLYSNITGTGNSAFGYNADVTTGNLTNATAIGYNAKVGQSNSLVLGGTGGDAVNVGIGTTTPTSELDVVGNVRINDKDIYLRSGSDTWHGLGWYGAGKLFAAANVNGPALYGNGGGALGTIDSLGQKIALTWNSSGNVNITGSLSKGSGSFKIDHPLEPKNKYLYHSFVESPDMMNIYNGNVTTDVKGYATITLPDWFEALNRDFRYQLTVIGRFAQAIVSEKMADNRFTIQTDKPGVEVSWQVTGIRKDAYAEAHRIPVEEEKPEAEKGSCLHKEACNEEY